MRTRVVAAMAGGFLITVIVACGGSESVLEPSALLTAQALPLDRCAPSAGGFTTNFTHPYFPAPVGQQALYTGEEGDEEVTLKITVLDQLRSIAGVTTRVIEEREWIDGLLVEVSWNYYAQASDGSVCYYGEDVDIYEDGGISHEGAWCGATPGNLPGIFLPADPRPGMKFVMELAPGIAEDEGEIVGSGPVKLGSQRYENTIRVREFNPLDGDKGFKVYAEGVGLIVDGPVELQSVTTTSGVPEQPVLVVQSCGS
jgi:hypothetical protein